MKETKRILCQFSLYDPQSIADRLHKMAEQGWMLTRAGRLFWQFRRCTPRSLRFSVTYFADVSDFDAEPTEGELDKTALCAADGWTLLLRTGVMQIFYTDDPDAVPLETDPVTQVDNMDRAVRKGVLYTYLLLVALTLWYLFLQMGQLRRDPTGYLSDPSQLSSLLLFGLLLLDSLCGVAGYYWWRTRARRAAQSGYFWGMRSWSVLHGVTLVLAFGLALVVLRTAKLQGFVLAWLAVYLVIILAGRGIRALLRRCGASRRVNQAVTLGGTLVLCLLSLSLLTGRDWSGTDGAQTVGEQDFPLLAGELTGQNGTWERTIDRQQTILLSQTTYTERGAADLTYTVTEIKAEWMQPWLRQAAAAAQRDQRIQRDFTLINHYVPADAAAWGADAAYQRLWHDGLLDDYLLFWDGRIVEISFYWTPTPAQRAMTGAALRPADR